MTRSTSDSGGVAPPGRDGAGSSARPRREEKKAAQREKILQAARQVFFRDGFIHANLDEVARLAEVAKGTLYRYFENKAELYVAVLFHDGEIFASRMREAANVAGDAAARLRSVGRFYLEHWMRNREYFEIFWALENQPVIGELPDSVVTEVARLWRECLQVLADIVEAGVREGRFRSCDPWAVAHLMWISANGLLRSEQVELAGQLRGRDLDAAFDDMVALFLRGLTAEPL